MDKPSFAPLIAPLQQRYAALTPRDRQALRVLTLTLGLALGAGIVDEVYQTRQALHLANPKSVAEFERLQQDAGALMQLRQRRLPADAKATTLIDSLTRSAGARSIEVHVDPAADTLQVSGRANLAQLMDWIATLQADYRLRPVQLQLGPDGTFRMRLKQERGET